MPVDQVIATALVVGCFSFLASYGTGMLMLRLRRELGGTNHRR